MVLKKQMAKNLKYQREQRKLTQEQAAELCDLSPSILGKIRAWQSFGFHRYNRENIAWS